MAGVMFIFGIGLGLPSESWLLSVAGNAQKSWALILLVTGPLSPVVAGLTLAVSDQWRRWILLPMAFLLGSILGVAITLDAASADQHSFAEAATAMAVWLVASVAFSWAAFERPWFRIGGRIIGSWLIAIGLMLGGSLLAPRSRLEPPSAFSPEGPVSLHGPNAVAPMNAEPRLPFAPPEADPSRQP